MDNFYLFINAVVWLCILSTHVRRYGYKNLGVVYLTFYALINLMAFHYYNNNDEGQIYEGQNLLFLLYNTYFIYLFCRPLVKSESKKRPLVLVKQRSVTILCIVVSAISLIGIYEIVTNFLTGLVMLTQDDSYGASLYHDLRMSMDEGKSGIANYVAVIINLARSISPLLFFVYLSFPKRKMWLVFALLLSSVTTILNAVSIGSRIAIIDGFMTFGFMMLFMWKYYDNSIKKTVTPVLVSLFAIVALGFVSITVSRSIRNNLNTLAFVEKYIAIGPLNFGKYGLDNGEIRYGDRTMPLVKSLFTNDVARTYAMRLDKYKQMKIDESTFATFVADFVFDYGVVFGTLIMLIIVMFFHRGINSPPGYMCLHNIVLIFTLISIVNGFYLYPMSDYLGNLKLLTLITLYFYLKLGANAIYKQKKSSYSTSYL